MSFPAPDVLPLSSERAVIEVVRRAVGPPRAVRVTHWHVRREQYVVASVDTEQPAMQLLVKLEVPGERPNRRLDVMAALADLVRARTTVPTFEVVAVDVSRRDWPWEYLIVTRLPGATWATLYPRLDEAARAVAQRQLGRSAAHLHTLRFKAFGQIRPDLSVEAFGQIRPAVSASGDRTAVAALQTRTLRRISTPRYRAAMLDVLESRAHLFAGGLAPTLCHEDLNPYNVLFELRDGQPVLSGVLDFESAWAGIGESDLARLELWWMTTGRAVREAYHEVIPLADGYAERRPVLQLLWCLEYAESHPSAAHQADTAAVCAELGIAPIPFMETRP